MLYVIYGDNVSEVLESRDSLIQKYSNENDILYFNDSDFSLDLLKHHTESQDLFNKKIVIVINDVLKTLDFNKSVSEIFEGIKNSDNIFIFIEESISAPILKKLSPFTKELSEFKLKKVENKNKFNVFSITDAIIARDKKQSWILYQEALKNSSPEEIAGIIFWAIKTLSLVVSSDKKDSSSINPYVLGKMKGKSNLWSQKEIDSFLHQLVLITNRSKSENFDLSISLERLIINSI
jgi:DNA polymerase III delta subunit